MGNSIQSFYTYTQSCPLLYADVNKHKHYGTLQGAKLALRLDK